MAIKVKSNWYLTSTYETIKQTNKQANKNTIIMFYTFQSQHDFQFRIIIGILIF